jgi:hypothetical protein
MQDTLQRQTSHLPLEVQPLEHAELRSIHLLDVGGRHRLLLRRHHHHPLPVQISMPHLQELGHNHETERKKRLKKPSMMLFVPSGL